MMIWRAACIVMPPLLVLSFLSFVRGDYCPTACHSGPAGDLRFGFSILVAGGHPVLSRAG